MPLDHHADREITAFKWVPPFAQGLVRDLRIRWALEEAGLTYREKLLDALSDRPADYFHEQPFGQVPAYTDNRVSMFESGAIVLYLAGQTDALMPSDPSGQARTMSWVVASLNSIEPMIASLVDIDLFNADAEWARARRPQAEENVRKRLERLTDWLGDNDYLEDRFTAGDLMMTTVLRILRHTALVEEHPTLARYKKRCEERPAFRKALSDQLARFDENAPSEETASSPAG